MTNYKKVQQLKHHKVWTKVPRTSRVLDRSSRCTGVSPLVCW